MGAVLFLLLCVWGGSSSFRAPAVPLLTLSPYFQVFATNESLPGLSTRYWDGLQERRLLGWARIAGSVVVWCGDAQFGSPAKQLGLPVVNATTTSYRFLASGVYFNVTFYNPLFYDEFNQNTGLVAFSSTSNIDFFFGAYADLAVSSPEENVVLKVDATATVASYDTNVLGLSGDDVGINWGFLALGAVGNNWEVAVGNLTDVAKAFSMNGNVSSSTVTVGPQPANASFPIVGASFSGVSSGVFVIGYNEGFSINWFNVENLAPTYALDNSFMKLDVQRVVEKCEATNSHVWSAANGVAGERYAQLCALAYRQTLAGVIYVGGSSRSGDSWWMFMKEISSDGDISTVDVIFPASPFFLLHNASLLSKLLIPVFEYAVNNTGNDSFNYTSVWSPHHLGVWPIADALSTTQEDMPVEESANMILMVAAITKQTGSFPQELEKYLPILKQWALYLQSTLPDPGNQLCTDDFTGASPNNVNLAAKGIVALSAYAEFIIGQRDPLYKFFAQTAKDYAENYWMVEAFASDHYLLEYRLNGTWSTKYNLFYQEILGLQVFPSSVLDLERSFYQKFQMKEFGVPLDNRAAFEKTDWLMWMWAGANASDFAAVNDALYSFYNTTQSRIPMSDWVWSSIPYAVGNAFKARPVVGAFFARTLLQQGK